MILVDTSVWVDHLRHGDTFLADLLERGDVVMHPFVVGELACGNLKDRKNLLGLLQQLPMIPVAEPDEVLGYVGQHKLHGNGIGYVDVHLLASTHIGNAKLWTHDSRLKSVAQSLRCAIAES